MCVCTWGLIGKDEIYDTGERRTVAGGKSSSRCEVGSRVRAIGAGSVQPLSTVTGVKEEYAGTEADGLNNLVVMTLHY